MSPEGFADYALSLQHGVQTAMIVTFGDSGLSADIGDSEELRAAIEAAFGTWRVRPAGKETTPQRFARKQGARFVLDGGDQAAPMTLSAVGAANRLVVDALESWIRSHPDQLCFHCASVLVGGRLVLFPSRARAGKSTLMAHLAAHGHVVFGDDALMIAPDDETGVAPGLALRLRLPLPETLGRRTAQFIERNMTAVDGAHAYLAVDGERFVAGGTRGPIGGMVLLQRAEGEAARLCEAPQSAVLKALIARNFSRAAPSADLIARLHALMERLPRYALVYSDLDEAAALIVDGFSTWPPKPAAHAYAARFDAPDDASDDEGEPEPTMLRGRAAMPRYRQNPSVFLRQVDGELFLAGPDASIHHLNVMGAGIWRLLAEPTDPREAADVIKTAFPDADPLTIEDDVAVLFTALAAEGYILPDGTGDLPNT